MSKSRAASAYERALLEQIGGGLRGREGGEAMVKELEQRLPAADSLAAAQLRFYAVRGATEIYNRHWHERVVSVVGRMKTAAMHIFHGEPARNARGAPTTGAIQKPLFDFETEADLLLLRARVERSVAGGRDVLELIDAVIDIRRRHPGLSGREAAAAEGIDPDSHTIDIRKYGG